MFTFFGHTTEQMFSRMLVKLLCSILVILFLFSQQSTAKKAHASDEKLGKGGLNPIIRQKYCNFDYYMDDDQNARIWSCVFKPTQVYSNEMQECVEQAFPEDDYGSSYHKMRKAVCSKDLNTSLRDFVMCIRQGKGSHHEHVVDKCLLIKSSKKRQSCYDKMQRDVMKCFASNLGITV
ncbi:uncharacterized protein LOC141857172 [Brevipalpus obovatus]|uniref:uncharacterized protein LOC141857172 n=1 Tax=Brevipalpus obovatus TaxID=246614 RepID=UPI003D9E37C7